MMKNQDIQEINQDIQEINQDIQEINDGHVNREGVETTLHSLSCCYQIGQSSNEVVSIFFCCHIIIYSIPQQLHIMVE